MKYQKRPLVIEAHQMDHQNYKSNKDWPEFLHKAWQKETGEEGSLHYSGGFPAKLSIQTLEGLMEISLDDFLIQGVNGEVYPCKPDIFNKSYTKIEE